MHSRMNQAAFQVSVGLSSEKAFKTEAKGMDGLIHDRQADGWMDGWMDTRASGQERQNGRTDGRTDRQTDS
jgi:hypothetical protein